MTAITRTSSISGKDNTREIDVCPFALNRWDRTDLAVRPFVQDAFPHLSADDREFIKTGITPEEWDAMFEDED